MARVDGPWASALEDPGLPARIAWSSDLGYGPVDNAVKSRSDDDEVEMLMAAAEKALAEETDDDDRSVVAEQPTVPAVG